MPEEENSRAIGRPHTRPDAASTTAEAEATRPTVWKHPLAAIAHEAAAEVRAFASEFGLSPSGRARIHVTAPEPEDALTRFLRDDPKAKYARPGSYATRRQR